MMSAVGKSRYKKAIERKREGVNIAIKFDFNRLVCLDGMIFYALFFCLMMDNERSF